MNLWMEVVQRGREKWCTKRISAGVPRMSTAFFVPGLQDAGLDGDYSLSLLLMKSHKKTCMKSKDFAPER